MGSKEEDARQNENNFLASCMQQRQQREGQSVSNCLRRLEGCCDLYANGADFTGRNSNNYRKMWKWKK
jgi:hypothetical protein